MAQPRPDDGPLLRLLSINVHKGMSAWRRRFVLAELREAVRSTGADVVCVHFGLGEAHRRHQAAALARLVADEVPAGEPLLIAGDFNDWRRKVDAHVRRDCGVASAFGELGDGCPRTFPARLPLLPLDRIYARGVAVVSAMVLSAMPWPHLSDHLPLLAEVAP